jgi:hypothetical protein
MDHDRQDIIIYNTSDGKDYHVTFYSLEMVLAIGYGPVPDLFASISTRMVIR